LGYQIERVKSVRYKVNTGTQLAILEFIPDLVRGEYEHFREAVAEIKAKGLQAALEDADDDALQRQIVTAATYLDLKRSNPHALHDAWLQNVGCLDDAAIGGRNDFEQAVMRGLASEALKLDNDRQRNQRPEVTLAQGITLMEHKRIQCTACGEVKGRGEFYNDPRKNNGKQSQCKQCMAEKKKSA
jgi:hypothetical protein